MNGKSEVSLLKNRKKITVQQIITLILVIFIISAVVFQVIYFFKDKKTISAKEPDFTAPPEYLFSIYGSEDKPLKNPMAVYVDNDNDGTIYVSSTNNHEIQVFNSMGRYKYSFGRAGTAPGELSFPYGIVRNPEGNLFISETGNGRIQEFTPEGKFLRIFASKSTKVVVEKPGPLVLKSGHLYIGDLVRHEVIVANLSGKPENTLSGIKYPHGISVDKQGNTIVADAGGYRVAIFDKLGKVKKSISQWNSGSRFSMLRGLAIDKAGRIYVVDTIVSSIRVFDSNGNFLFDFGRKGSDNGQFLFPTGIFIDEAKNRIYVVDWGNNRVEVWGYQ